MKPADVRAELEAEWNWRNDELLLLGNQVRALPTEDEREQLRRSCVVMVYAHFEGFCKNACIIYIGAVNKEGVACTNAHPMLAAASLSATFKSLNNPLRKDSVFKQALPDDSDLHLLARRKDFVEDSGRLLGEPLALADEIADTGSNLKPLLLKRMLYTLALDHGQVDTWGGRINRLLNMRNGIAHGSMKRGVSAAEYTDVEKLVREVVTELTVLIYDAFKDRAFEK